MAHPERPRWVASDQEDLARLPKLLYHIQHADSQATYSDSEIGIKAADTAFGQLSVSELADHALKHQNWYNQRPSYFILAFKKSKHTRNWGLQQKGPVYMYTINTRLMPRSAGKWVTWVSNTNEYLILDQIPRDAIVASEEIKPRTVTAAQMTSVVDKCEHLKPWAVPHYDLPPRLYFIQHAGSQSTDNTVHVVDSDGAVVESRNAIESVVQDIKINNFSELCEKIEDHVNWYQRRPSMFISAFSVRNHAVNWGRQRDGPVWMYEIDTSVLPANQLVFRADQLTANCSRNEYLFLQQIPFCPPRQIELLKGRGTS